LADELDLLSFVCVSNMQFEVVFESMTSITDVTFSTCCSVCDRSGLDRMRLKSDGEVFDKSRKYLYGCGKSLSTILEVSDDGGFDACAIVEDMFMFILKCPPTAHNNALPPRLKKQADSEYV
jgi:hypothetical protein